MPIQLTQQLTTLDEFTEWQAYFIRRRNETDKIDWYLAAISNAIYRTMGNNAKSTIEGQILKFEPPKPRAYDVEYSKGVYMAAYGLNPDGTWNRPHGT